MHYLQDEYASLIVQGRFDKATSQTFRALQKNTSGLNAHALQNLIGHCNLGKFYQQRINQGVNWQQVLHGVVATIIATAIGQVEVADAVTITITHSWTLWKLWKTT